MNHRTATKILICTVYVLYGRGSVPGQPNDVVLGNQDAPGLTPEKFMPGIISTDDHFEFTSTISPNEDEICFTRRIDNADVVMMSKKTPDGWSEPEPFEALNRVGGFEVHMSPVRDRVYFSRLAPPPGMEAEGPPKTQQEEAMLVGVWYMDRTDSGWSDPAYCTHGMYVTTTQDGTIYTTDIREPIGISYSKLVDGKYSNLLMLGGGVNNPEPGAHPCIDPNETFIVFDSEREGGYGKSDLYVCFRQEDGSWSDAINLGQTFNSAGPDFCPSLSPDSRYLFFSSNGDIYWVSVSAVTNLRP